MMVSRGGRGKERVEGGKPWTWMVQNPRDKVQPAQPLFQFTGVDAAGKAHAAAPMNTPLGPALGDPDPVVGEDQDVPDPLQVEPPLTLCQERGMSRSAKRRKTA